MTKHHRPSRRVLSRNRSVRRAVWVGTAGVSVMFLAVTGAAFAEYDAYTGSYNAPYVNYSSPTWTKTTDSVVGGSKSKTSSGTSGTNSSTGSDSTTSSVPDGAVSVKVHGTYGNLVNITSGGREERVAGDWASMKIYPRNTATNRPDLTQASVGVLLNKKEGSSYIYGDGYYFADQLPGATRVTITAQATGTGTGTSTSTATNTTSTSTSTSTATNTTSTSTRTSTDSNTSTSSTPARVSSDDGAAPPPVIRESPAPAPAPTVPEPTPAPETPTSTATAIATVHVPVDRATIAASVGAPISATQESAAASLVTKVLGASTMSAVSDATREAMVTYVAYGHTPETAKIGSGERASTVERFNLLYGSAPTTDTDFRALQAMIIESGVDIVKVKRAIEAEKKGLGAFRRIYGYLPATTVKDQVLIDAEWKALRIITYGLKPLRRDLTKERSAIKQYTAKFGTPKVIGDWDGIRACVYGSPTTCPLLR